MDGFLTFVDTWWAVYSNVVLTIGINGLDRKSVV